MNERLAHLEETPIVNPKTNNNLKNKNWKSMDMIIIEQ
jgi:hypothetical protein